MTGVALTGGGTGGHLYPLIAVAEQLRQLHPDLPITFVGSDSRLEAKVVPTTPFPFVGLPVVSVPRKPGMGMFKALGKLWQSYAEARRWLRQARPGVVVGAGGYISVPLVLAAAMARVPVVLLEQNAEPGLATRLLAPLAQSVCVSFEATQGRFRRSLWTGNALRAGIGQQPRDPGRFGLDPARPTLLVMGGSLGARRLNGELAELAPRILAETDWQILHLTGDAGFEPTKADLQRRGLADAPRYTVMAYCTDMPALLAVADLAIARAGATSVAELALANVPTVYVPYPGANHHQAANARAAVAAGAARLLLESDLSAESLWETVGPLLIDQKARLAMAHACGTIAMPGAAKAIAEQVMAQLTTGAPPASSAREGTSA